MITEFTQEEIRHALSFYLGSDHTVTGIKGRNGRNSGEFTVAVTHTKNFKEMEPTIAEVPPSKEQVDELIAKVSTKLSEDTEEVDTPWDTEDTTDTQVTEVEEVIVEETKEVEEVKPSTVGSLFGSK